MLRKTDCSDEIPNVTHKSKNPISLAYYTTECITKSETHALSLKNAIFRDSTTGNGSKTKRN